MVKPAIQNTDYAPIKIRHTALTSSQPHTQQQRPKPPLQYNLISDDNNQPSAVLHQKESQKRTIEVIPQTIASKRLKTTNSAQASETVVSSSFQTIDPVYSDDIGEEQAVYNTIAVKDYLPDETSKDECYFTDENTTGCMDDADAQDTLTTEKEGILISLLLSCLFYLC